MGSLLKTKDKSVFRVPLIWDSNTAYFNSDDASIVINDRILVFSIDMELVLNTSKIHREYISEDSDGEYDHFKLDVWNLRMYDSKSNRIPIKDSEYIDLIFKTKKKIKW